MDRDSRDSDADIVAGALLFTLHLRFVMLASYLMSYCAAGIVNSALHKSHSTNPAKPVPVSIFSNYWGPMGDSQALHSC